MSPIKSSLARSLRARFGAIKGLMRFLKENRMWWMIPMVGLLVVFFLLIVFAQSSPLGPFIYTLF